MKFGDTAHILLVAFLTMCGVVLVAGVVVLFLPSGDADVSSPAVKQTQVLRVPESGDGDRIRVIEPFINGRTVTCVLYDGYEAVAIDCLDES